MDPDVTPPFESAIRWLSPTFKWSDDAKNAAIARHADEKDDQVREDKQRHAVAAVIKERNSWHLRISALVVLLFATVAFFRMRIGWQIIGSGWLVWLPHFTLLAIASVYAFSRTVEVFWAFLRDVVHQTKYGNTKTKSSLEPWERIQLALKGSVGLMLGFGILLYFLSERMLSALILHLGDDAGWARTVAGWFSGPDTRHILEAVYYSGITITTTAYGDFAPTGIIPHFLALYALSVGIVLIVVCFAIYAGRVAPPTQRKGEGA
jgi:voltage-gated potassium channel